jgi:hypothetical protein
VRAVFRIPALRLKVIKNSQNSRNLGFSYYFCLMMKRSGSEPLTNGSGSRGPKNLRIIVVRIRNTNWEGAVFCYFRCRVSLFCWRYSDSVLPKCWGLSPSQCPVPFYLKKYRRFFVNLFYHFSWQKRRLTSCCPATRNGSPRQKIPWTSSLTTGNPRICTILCCVS